MAASGFFEQKPRSPVSFGMVLLLHGAAIAGVVMIKNPEFAGPDTTLVANLIREQEPPPPVPPPLPSPKTDTVLPAPPAPSPPTPEVQVPTSGPTFSPGPTTTTYDPRTAATAVGTGGTGVATIPIETRRPPPVRTQALFDPRFADAQQPPYPTVELRSEREGNVRVEVRIGTDGRVKAVTRLSATSDAFWRATERHALSRWRFRPATEDGRPIESSKTLTVHFQLDGS